MTRPGPLSGLLDLLTSSGPGPFKPVDWRVHWSASTQSSVGVRDRMKAGVHTPLAISRGFALDYLFQWEDGRISTGAAEKIGIEDPEPFLRLSRLAAYDDPDGAVFAGPAAIPDFPLFCADAAAEAASGGAGTFAGLIGAAQSRAAKWTFGTWSGSTSARSGEMGVVTSRGLQVTSRATRISYSFWFEGRSGDGHSSREPIPPAEAEARIERSCDPVHRLGSPEPSFEPGTMSVLLHPGVVEALLSTYVLTNLHGSRIAHGQSAFRIEQFGSEERVFSPALCLRLEPCVPMDVGSFRFTGEGLPARPVSYIEGGRLVSPILDMKYAKRLGRETAPGPLSSDSLRFAGARTLSESEALRAAGRGVFVLSLLGLHTQDPTRGDFSVSAPQCLAIRGGALGGAVKAVLTGNFFEVLRDPGIGFVEFEGFRTPGLLYSGSVGLAPGV